MRILFISLMLVLPLQAEKVTFDTDYSLEFPEGWKKAENADKSTLVYRVSKNEDASFAVAKLPLPKDAKADLKATLDAILAGMKKTMKFTDEPKTTEGGVDGKKAFFSRVFTKTGDHNIGYFLVAIDCKDRVFILQATIPAEADNKSRTDCMAIIKSFKQEKK